VRQDVARIHASIEDKSFFSNKVLLRAMQVGRRTLHIMGLLSDAGVHSHIKHLFAILDLAKQGGVRRLRVHVFLDGRDVPPRSAAKYLSLLESKLEGNADWCIGTVQGRYYAMDRDNRWDRTKRAYTALVHGDALHAMTAQEALKEAYAHGETDEFVQPYCIGEPSLVHSGDSVIFFNFRADRARQITHAFTDGKVGFQTDGLRVRFTCLTEYESGINASVVFPPEVLKNTLGEIISKNGRRQFRIAETEKWAHVTFFFNGLSDRRFKGEDRKLIPSRKVSTYDKTPAMRAEAITKESLMAIKSKKYSLVLLNYANPDMVGHTGMLDKTVRAIKSTDNCLGRLVPAALAAGFDVIITADHGNAEQMQYPDGSPMTSHTTADVPCIILTKSPVKLQKIVGASLANIAPTVLTLMGLRVPKAMTGKSLIKIACRK